MSLLARTIDTKQGERHTQVDTNTPGQRVDTPATAPATPRNMLEAPDVAGRRVGRYVLVRLIGEGGMGMVYLARDPELNRDIALKLLRARKRAHGGRAWLLREAQALAQLSHPNVIAIHDVGALGDEIFIAMQLVDGQTVRRWLKSTEPTPAQIVDVYLRAARGLAAAHRAGLVHRDFKPDNVMVSKDGRVRVVDFGLARTSATTTDSDAAVTSPASASGERDSDTQPTEPPSDVSAPTPDSDDLLGSPLTRKGVVVGTPAYMAPEQLRGDDIDDRADQFAFCVALYEGLCGESPFTKRDRRKLHKGSEDVRAKVPAKAANMPRPLWRVLSRGMAIAPAERFASMDAVIAAIETAMRPSRRLLLAGAAVATVAVAAVAFALVPSNTKQQTQKTAICQSAAAEVAKVWNSRSETQLRQSFAATKLGHAGDIAERTISKLNHYAQAWRQMHTAACEATHVRGVQSGALLDVRMMCLERRRRRLSGLVGVLTTKADATVVDSAVVATMSLPKVTACANVRALTAMLPGDKATRAQVLAVRKRLDELESVRSAGKYRASLPIAEAIATKAATIEFALVQAEALHVLGSVLMKNDALKRAEKVLYEGATAAAKAKADSKLAAIWLDLVWCVGERQRRPDEGLALSKNAEVAIERAGNDPVQRAKLHFVLGALSFSKGKYAQTREHFHKSLVLREQALGKDHTEVGESASALSMALSYEGRYDEAQRYSARARQIREKAYGPSHPSVARTYSELAGAAARAGKNDRARVLYRKALVVLTKAYGPKHATVADILGNLGGVTYDLGERDEAKRLFERALVIRRAVYGDNHTRVAVSHYNITLMYLFEKDYRNALEHIRASLRIYTANYGAEHLHLAGPLVALAQTHIGLGQADKAIRPLQRSLRIHKATHGTAHDYGEATFALAQAHMLKRDRTQAVKLAKQARRHYVTAGARSEKELAAVKKWLSKHR